jgi:diguanylate cyclase (GGDEF)-like protein/PAS domain S-box-containing protein
MKTSIRSWFAPPVFPGDEEKTRRAELTSAVIITVAVFATLVFVGNLLGGRIPFRTLAIDLSITGSCVFLYFNLRKGRIEFAGIGVVTIGGILLTAGIASVGTIRVPSTGIYLLVVIISGLLFDRMGILISTVLCSLTVLGLIVAENMGILPAPDYSVNVTQWITYTLLFGLTGSVISIATRATKQALTRAESELAERRKIEAVLKENEAHYRHITSTISDIAYLCVATPDGFIIEWVSGAVEQITGYTADEMKAMHCWGKLVVDDDLHLFKEFVISVAPGSTASTDLRIRHKDGNIRWINSYTECVVDEKGHRLYGGLVDITERKQAEEKLRESEDLFKYVFDYSVVGKSITKLSHETHVNKAFCDMLGYSLEEFGERRWQEITHPDDIDLTQREVDALLSGEKTSARFIKRFIHKNGSAVWVDLSSSLRRDRDGKPLYLVTTLADITERKLMEDNLRRRTETLTALQATILDISSPHPLHHLLNLIVERAANLLDASSGGLYLTEPEQRKVRCVVSYKTKGDFTGTLLDFGVGAAGHVAETGQPLIIDDYNKWNGRADVYEEKQPFNAVMSAPMLWQGKVTGVIHLLRDDDSKKFTQEGLNLLLLFANHAAVAVENARLFNLLDKELAERKRTEELLEQTRKNYETFFNSIDEFLFVLDENGNILHTNKTVTDRLGYSTEELFEQSVLLVHPPERREEAGKIVAEMLAGTAEFCPVPVMTKLGERIPVETRVTPGFWDGRPVIFGVTKDISQIALSEEKFSKAFHSNSALMALSRVEDGIFIDVNEVFLETLGFSRDEIIGKNSRELGLFPDISWRDTMIEMMRQKKTVRNMDVVVRTKGGSLRNGLFSGDTIYIGKDLCLLTVMVDITERKKIEADLRESEKRHRSLFEQTHDAVFILDFEGHHLDANQRAADMLGYSREEMKNLSVNNTSAELEKSQAITQRLLAGETIPLYERLFRKKDGQIFPAEINVELVRDTNGNPLHIQSVVRDISRRKQAEESLHVANDELQKRIQDVEKLRDELREQSIRDPLTGLYNRRYMQDVFRREFSRAVRENYPVSVAMLDMDELKMFNDTYGHGVGDLTIRALASHVQTMVRTEDIVCRYGGDEIIIILAKTTAEDAMKRVGEWREAMNNHPMEIEGKQQILIKFTAGIASFPAHGTSLEEVVNYADVALYRAKARGRNCTVMFK